MRRVGRVRSHRSNVILNIALSAARVPLVGILAWFLFVGQGVAQNASEDLAPSAAGKTPSHRAIAVADAIGMTRFLSFDKDSPTSKDEAALFSPDGNRFLILTERGNLEGNTRVYSLFLFRSDTALQSPQRRLLVSFSSSSNRPGIHAVKWLDNRSIAFLGESSDEGQQLYTIDCHTKRLAKLTKHETGLSSYAVSADGERLFYTAYLKSRPLFDVIDAVVVSNQALPDLVTGRDRYRSEVINELFSKRRQDEHEVRLQAKGDLINERWLSLSPNGRYLLVKTSVKEIPTSWKAYEDAFLQVQTRGRHLQGTFSFIYQYEVFDTYSGQGEVLIDAPLARGGSDVIWSSDSSAVVISGTYLPLDVGDPAQRKMRESTKFVVELKIPSREIVPITSKSLKLLKWDSGAAKLLGQESGAPPKLLEYQKDSTGWKAIDAEEPGTRDASEIEIAVEEDMNTPPRVFATSTKTRQKSLLVDANPQFENINLGSVEEVSFKSSDGRQVRAGLYRPPGYTPGRKCPLVIQTHGWNAQRFWMDGPYSTAYAARPLANNGFVVLQVDDEDWTKLGTLDEVREAVAVYEGGIDYLDGLDLIDRTRVGIIGFSRSGLFVQYALTHSKYRFAVATLADISDAGYFRYLALFNLSSGFVTDSEGINGGAPFGSGLASWMENSPGFNLEKVTAPVRMEADNPMSLFFAWEWFAGLSRLTKPVELIYMADGAHPLVKPWERMTSQQADVDWFCFWLKGEEDPDPAKAEQYARWRDLRTLQQENLKSAPKN
jgi:dipeptidyl aminopeptidase/acylaminoacyl peptidase